MCGQCEMQAHHSHGGCCCQPGGFRGRPVHGHFPSREERVARLEEYLKDVQAEAKAVEERLTEIRSAG